mmetsp:Transcript_96788/g.278464  ORF Transcript_96788/g.278464 Transcript_96788/m.278464 type:complete len:261 (+) Transcript_96788:141-923(+)
MSVLRRPWLLVDCMELMPPLRLRKAPMPMLGSAPTRRGGGGMAATWSVSESDSELGAASCSASAWSAIKRERSSFSLGWRVRTQRAQAAPTATTTASTRRPDTCAKTLLASTLPASACGMPWVPAGPSKTSTSTGVAPSSKTAAETIAGVRWACMPSISSKAMKLCATPCSSRRRWRLRPLLGADAGGSKPSGLNASGSRRTSGGPRGNANGDTFVACRASASEDNKVMARAAADQARAERREAPASWPSRRPVGLGRAS